MSRRKFIAGNWKMHMGPGRADTLAQDLRRELLDLQAVDLAVAPPFISIPEVVARLRHTGIHVAAQNLHWEPRGAFTGEITAEMLRDSGCTYVIIGHSERRRLFGETDPDVNRKLHAALRAGLLPIVCIGESLEQRESGKATEVVTTQLETDLAGITDDHLPLVTIAYEPIWAIGTGRTASPPQAQEIHAAIRSWLRQHYSSGLAAAVRILYGGSVNHANAGNLLRRPDIDGALVGGASLKASSFAAIARAAGSGLPNH